MMETRGLEAAAAAARRLLPAQPTELDSPPAPEPPATRALTSVSRSRAWTARERERERGGRGEGGGGGGRREEEIANGRTLGKRGRKRAEINYFGGDVAGAREEVRCGTDLRRCAGTESMAP